MKHCTYTYKGREIGDVKALNDFLLEKKPFENSLGDMVFQYNSRQLDAIEKLKKAAAEKVALEKAYKKAKDNAKQYGADEEAMLKMERPYVGVSEFLAGQRNVENKLYFPEFIPQEYWSRRYHEWAKGNFSDDEIAIFFDGDKSKVVPVPLGNAQDWKENGKLKEDFGTDEQKRLRDLMQDKWEHQAKYGTEIHNVLQKFFSKSGDANNPKTLWYKLLEDPKIAGMQKANFIKALRDNGDITDVTTDANIDKILEYAKELKTSLEAQFGKDLLFYPEFTLSADLNKEYEGRTDLKLLGRVDLLVVDSNGIPHIVDYKTSPKQYENYSTAKTLNFTYQLATYERMLRRWGFNTTDTDIMVAPLQMTNFRRENNQWTYDTVERGTTARSPLKPLTDKLSEDYLTSNLDEFIEAPLTLGGVTENVITQVTEAMQKLFPKYGDNKKKTDEEIKQLIEEQNGFTLNSDTGRYEYLPKGFSKPISASEKEGESVLFKRVKDFYTRSKERNVNKTSVITKAIKAAQKQDGILELPEDTDEWVRAKLSKYCDPNWKVIDDEAAQQFGMIILQNSDDLIEVVKISNNNLKYENSWGPNNKNLIGAHESDITEDSRSDSLMLKAANGNIELIEAMLVLNNIGFSKNVQLGGIQVISPFSTAMGLTASNKELKYNWTKLMSIAKGLDLDITDNFNNGNIKMLSNAEQCFQEFQEVLRRVTYHKVEGNYEQFKPIVTQLHSALVPNNVDDALAALDELRSKLEKEFKMGKDVDRDGRSLHSGIVGYDQQYAKTLYQSVNKAILELNNFNVRQSLKDHDSWLESVHIIQNGMSGTYIDNAGNFGNQMLNQITSIALEGYQNARDMAYGRLRELRNKVEQLKKDTGYAGLVEHTFGNQTSLYNGMTYYDKSGNLLFINPWKDTKGLSPKKAEFLKYVILELNKNTHPNLSEAQIKEKIEDNNTEFFQVPLIEASFASKVNTDGWLGWLKKRLKMFSGVFKGDFSNLKQYVRDKQTEFFSDAEEKSSKIDGEIFKVTNMMNQGNDSRRLEIIDRKRKQYGDGYFERDLEAILSSHIWAYSTTDALKDRMPLIKAAFISLSVMGNDQNYSFSKDEKFLQEFVANRINHQSIVEEKYKTLKGVTGIAQRVASWMALAFSPVQMSYQSLEGIWKDAKLIITKPDGTETFSLKNMQKAAKTVYKELFNYSDNATVATAINAQYGINDMDNVAFAENNTSNRHGMYNFFGKMAYKFASRPDFYNRMTIFAAQMMEDGSWEAHSVDPKTNELIYDWKKDKRFAAYAKDKEGKNGKTEEWQKAKAMYYTVAGQLVREGVRKKDGTLFKVGDDLPKAYSNKESEAKKAVGDNMYGYYDSTKKSLMQSTMLGGLLMQMRTYWSAKKNQYLAPGGIKSQGKWVQATQEMINPKTGVAEVTEMYYPKNENGDIDIHGPLVPKWDENRSDTPFLQWQGKFEEGVLVTMFGMLKAMNNTSIKEGWNLYMNNADENLRKTYKSNLKLLACDFLMWLLIGGAALLLGDWADDEAKEAKESGHFDDALYAAYAGLVYKTVYNSKLDMAWWESIFNVSMDWNPFVVSYIGNEAKAIGNLLTGDASFADTIVKSFSAARQVRPIFTFLDQEEA